MTTGIDTNRSPCIYAKLRLEGKYRLTVKRKGKVIHFSKGKNLVVDEGLLLVVTNTFIGGNAVEYLSLGTGNASPVVTDTALDTEVLPRVLGGVSVAANQVTITFQFTAVGDLALKEMGIHDAATSGSMFSRFLTQEVDLVLDDVVDVIWILQATGG